MGRADQARRRVETVLFATRRALAAATSINQLLNSRAPWDCQTWRGSALVTTVR